MSYVDIPSISVKNMAKMHSTKTTAITKLQIVVIIPFKTILSLSFIINYHKKSYILPLLMLTYQIDHLDHAVVC